MKHFGVKRDLVLLMKNKKKNIKKQRINKLPGKVRKGIETDFTGLPMNPFDSKSWIK